jgi:hypothetical protein
MTMFRVTFFCDDRKLGECLHGLAGLAQGTPEVVPVVNAVAGTNGSGPRAMTDNGNLIDMFTDWLRKTRTKQFKAQDAREFVKSIGMSPASYSYMLNKAKDRGLIRRTGSGAATSVWHVMPARAKKARATTAKAKKARPATAAASN